MTEPPEEPDALPPPDPPRRVFARLNPLLSDSPLRRALHGLRAHPIITRPTDRRKKPSP